MVQALRSADASRLTCAEIGPVCAECIVKACAGDVASEAALDRMASGGVQDCAHRVAHGPVPTPESAQTRRHRQVACGLHAPAVRLRRAG